MSGGGSHSYRGYIVIMEHGDYYNIIWHIWGLFGFRVGGSFFFWLRGLKYLNRWGLVRNAMI